MAYVDQYNHASLEQYYTNPSLRSASGPYTKSHATTPPPLRSAAARVRQQTLGPVFSDEEDGDDTEYIAMRMKEMAMSQGYGSQAQQASAAAQMHQLQLQQQALALQQQYLLQQLLSSQQQQPHRGQPGARDNATSNAIRQQQMHQMQQLQLQAQMRQQQQVDPRIQAQLLSQLQASARGPAQQQAEMRAQQQAEFRAQALAAQAQLQAQVQARAQALARAQLHTQEIKEVNEKDMKARFESQPNTGHQLSRLSSKPTPKTASDKPTTPPSSTSPIPAVEESPPKPTAPLGRFAQARQTASSPFGELTALLARRSAGTATPPKTPSSSTLPTTQSPTTAATEDRLAARQGLQSIGLGRPTATIAQSRAKSNPFPTSPNVATQPPAVRAVSLAQPLKPIRQPFGPPAPTNELGERNFQANVRKQASKGLGMLGRRAEGSGASSPVIA